MEALHNRGVALKAARRLDDALASFDAAVTARPDFVPSRRGAADVLTHLGRYDDAVGAATAAMALAPSDAGPVTDRAFALMRGKRCVPRGCDEGVGVGGE